MINLGTSIQSNNSNMTTLLRRTWSKVDDGNGPDGVDRSHIINFVSPSSIAIYPNNSSDKMRVQKIEVAFGVSSWNGNTSPSNFVFQYTNDSKASYDDPVNDSRWVTVKSYTSWSHKSGIVNISVDFTCRKIRIFTSRAYQGTYYQSTVFRIHGEIITAERFLLQDGVALKTLVDNKWSIAGLAPPTKEMFDLYGQGSLSTLDRVSRKVKDSMDISNITVGSGKLFRKIVSLNKHIDVENIEIINI